MGTLRGWRPPVPPRAVRPPVLQPRAADGHDGRRLPPAAARADDDLSRLVDRRQSLHLDRPSGRPARLESARRCPRRAGRGVRGRAGRPGAGARGSADRRRQRLVLVVRRRPLVGARPGVRRSVPPAPAQRLSPAGAADSRRAVRQQHLDGRTGGGRDARRRPSSPPRSTARRRATSSGWAPARSRFETSPARCIGPTASRAS